MSKYEIKNTEGKKVGDADLSADVYGIEPNIPVVHQVVTCQAASLRQGTHSTKNRHEVSGGGVIFGPTPRSHARRVNSKMVKLAMRSVLSGKVADSELVLVDNLEFDTPSTKQAVAVLKALGLEDKRVTLLVPDDDINTYLSFRNLKKVSIFGVSEATTRSLIDNAALVMSADIAKQLGEVLA